MAATLADISRRLNLTPATVSKILRGYPGYKYKEETRQRVLAIAKELDYRPNLAARALLNNQSFLLGVMDLAGNTWALADLLAGIQKVASSRRYSSLVFTHESPESQDDNAKLCLDRRVDGMIVSILIDQQEKPYVGELAKFLGKKLPIVEIHGSALAGVPSIRFDYQAAGRMMIEHLVALGHRHIVVTPYTDVTAKSSLRFWYIQEYVRGCVEAAAALRAQLILPGRDYRAVDTNWSWQAQLADIIRAIREADPQPTAMAFYGTSGAEGMLRALSEHGFTVPQNFSFIMYEDYLLRPYITDPITVVRHDGRQVGQKSAELLFAKMDGAKRVASIKIAPSLSVGRTTQPLATQ